MWLQKVSTSFYFRWKLFAKLFLEKAEKNCGAERRKRKEEVLLIKVMVAYSKGKGSIL